MSIRVRMTDEKTIVGRSKRSNNYKGKMKAKGRCTVSHLDNTDTKHN